MTIIYKIKQWFIVFYLLFRYGKDGSKLILKQRMKEENIKRVALERIKYKLDLIKDLMEDLK